MQADKGRLYSTLASLSMLFLMAFLIYWNVDNYRRTKRALKQDLADQMDLAIAEYQDSLIQGIFKSIEVDSTGDVNFDATYVFSTDHGTNEISLQTHNVYGKGQSKSDTSAQGQSSTVIDTSLTVMYDAANDRKVIAWNNDISYVIKIDSFDFETIDLTDSTTFDSLTTLMSDITSRNKSLNTKLPKIYSSINDIYIQRLQQADLPTNHSIRTLKQIGTTDISAMAIPYTYGTLSGDHLPYAVFEKSGVHIFRVILPSLILSLLLLGGIATSFYLILKNWRDQLHLTAVKEEFISNMTHELKTPISTVGVALEALENFGVIDDKEKRKEYLDISKHELDRLNILVDKVIKMSTLDQDLDSLRFEDLDIREITEDMLRSMSLHFKKHDTSINYSYNGVDFIVQGDKVHMINVLYNIIDNAIKYSGKGAIVHLELIEDLQYIVLAIKDHGPGIDKVYLPKIFDRMFRVPSDARHNVKGYGLGLHYAKTVIEKHQGTISVTSEIGKATTFLIKIPKIIA